MPNHLAQHPLPDLGTRSLNERALPGFTGFRTQSDPLYISFHLAEPYIAETEPITDQLCHDL